MYPLRLCFSNGTQKCGQKIMNTEETETEKTKEKNFDLKTQYWSLEFS